MAKRKGFRVGFIGAGGIARGHFKRLLEVPGVEVTALCDPSEESLRRFVDACPEAKDLPTYPDYKKMLKGEELDGVQIHSVHTVHYRQLMDSLAAGLHVLVEKPMVCKVSHALEVVEAVEKSGKVVVLSYQRHHAPEFKYIKECIEQQKYGPVHFITAMQSQNWYGSQIPRKTWRSQLKWSGGGQLNDSGSHLVDIILWCSGLVPEEVFADIDNLGAEVDILTAASVKFTSGALCNISVIGHATAWWEDISFYCDKGALLMRQGRGLVELDAKGAAVEIKRLPKAGNPDAHWVNVIRGKEKNIAPPVCGLRVIQLTEAAWKSGASGRPQKVKTS